MLKIEVKKEHDKYTRIILNGHACYDDYGKDIVCAAASSIFITTVNAIYRFNEKSIHVISNKDEQILEVKDLTVETKILLDNMIDLFSDLQTNYKKNIKIIK